MVTFIIVIILFHHHHHHHYHRCPDQNYHNNHHTIVLTLGYILKNYNEILSFLFILINNWSMTNLIKIKVKA